MSLTKIPYKDRVPCALGSAVPDRSSQPGVASVPRGHVAISEDVFGFYDQGGGPRTLLKPYDAQDAPSVSSATAQNRHPRG